MSLSVPLGKDKKPPPPAGSEWKKIIPEVSMSLSSGASNESKIDLSNIQGTLYYSTSLIVFIPATYNPLFSGIAMSTLRIYNDDFSTSKSEFRGVIAPSPQIKGGLKDPALFRFLFSSKEAYKSFQNTYFSSKDSKSGKKSSPKSPRITRSAPLKNFQNQSSESLKSTNARPFRAATFRTDSPNGQNEKQTIDFQTQETESGNKYLFELLDVWKNGVSKAPPFTSNNINNLTNLLECLNSDINLAKKKATILSTQKKNLEQKNARYMNKVI